MSRLVVRGLDGTNPLGFLAAMGLLRVMSRVTDSARLGFLTDGSFAAFVEGFEADLAALVADDAARGGKDEGWWLEYGKKEKKGVKVVADLKPPPDDFAAFLSGCVERWLAGDGVAAAYAAAFGTSTARDRNKNTKPTAFHFTAAQQHFLDTLDDIRKAVDHEWARQSLFVGHAQRSGKNLRWDLGADRSWALMANDPNDDGTTRDAPLEWLAFRGLPLFPSFPRGTQIVTTSVSGRSGEMRMTWPLWSVAVTVGTARSALQLAWTGASGDRVRRAVFAVCSSAIRRADKGFGSFSPKFSSKSPLKWT